MEYKQIKDQLIELSEEGYRQFSSRLIPNTDHILGVRLPALRKLAQHIAKGDWRVFLAHAESEYFEEIMLQGMVIRYVKADVEEILEYVANFIPKINNWSVCDSFCIGLKFTRKNKKLVWSFIQPYLSSNKEYDIRFGVVMLLNYFIDEEYIHRVLQLLDGVKHEGYYVKMAVAWALADCYVKLPEPTMTYLNSNTLDDFTYNKALQKMTESNRLDQATKAMIRSMKRK
ncbi:DNA alkylation repair protein [Paenibacillus marinisediminis]